MYRNILRPDIDEDFHSHDHRVLSRACSCSACGNLVSSQDRTELQADLVDRGLWIREAPPIPPNHMAPEKRGRDTLLLQTDRQMYLLIIQQM